MKVSWESQLWVMLVLEMLSVGIFRGFEISKYGGEQNDQESTQKMAQTSFILVSDCSLRKKKKKKKNP